jgi:hypothetical protein
VAQTTVESLEEQLGKSRQDQMRAASNAERLSAEIAVLTEKNTAAAKAAQGALHQAVQSAEKLKLSASRLQDQEDALRDSEQILKDRNAQFSLLLLKESIVRDRATATRTVQPRVGQTPLGLAFENAQLRPTFGFPAVLRRKRHAEWDAVTRSGLFDADWYLARNPDVAAARVPAFHHFMTHGIAEYRDPHPLFSSGWYRIQMQRYNELLDLPPLLHYLLIGRAKHLSPHPLFDPQYYLATYKDIAESGIDPLQHFLMHGAREWRNPHPLIWMQRLAEQPGFPAGSRNVLVDYLGDAGLFAASPHPLFDGGAYLAENPDVARAGVNPLLHYCVVGWRQGRTASWSHCGIWWSTNRI